MTILILALAAALFLLGAAFGAVGWALYSLAALAFRQVRAGTARADAARPLQHPSTYQTLPVTR